MKIFRLAGEQHIIPYRGTLSNRRYNSSNSENAPSVFIMCVARCLNISKVRGSRGSQRQIITCFRFVSPLRRAIVVESIISAHISLGYPNIPVDIAGNAKLRILSCK